ncbi:hypothetical protein QAD02_006737 [Eretmocerus hayati]|uniref:Uncharacterized protein n=1 Tax=Eretmocerus hayati TaxID=131215 RepID=A0ACC2N1Q9_9HYME|nr:hypothetical protein QAD02_006737 [Eretmocerus hayati]
MIVELIGKRLLINGYVYLKGNTDEHRKVTWKCKRYRRGGCRAKFVTSDPAMSEKLLIYRGIAGSQHNHDPSIDEIREAEGLSKSGSKRISWELLANYPSSSERGNQGEIIPPVPAAIPIRDLLPSEQDIHPIRPNEVNVKKEIVLVDLTDDSNVKQEKNSSGIDQRTQSIQGNGSTNTPENSLNRSSNSVGVEIPMVGSSHPNLLHEQTLKAFFPQIYSQNQPSTNINFQNVLNCSGHQPVNHTSANPDVTVPTLIPVVISIPYMKSDGTTEMKQVFSHLIQINPQTQAQPVESQQPQGSIK